MLDLDLREMPYRTGVDYRRALLRLLPEDSEEWLPPPFIREHHSDVRFPPSTVIAGSSMGARRLAAIEWIRLKARGSGIPFGCHLDASLPPTRLKARCAQSSSRSSPISAIRSSQVGTS